MYRDVYSIYLLWLLFLTAKVSTFDHPIILRRLTRQTQHYGTQNISVYSNYQNQPQTLNNPGQQWNRPQSNLRYQNNVSSQQNFYPKIDTTNVLTRNGGTGSQWQSTAAPYTNNIYLNRQTPPPGSGPEQGYYQVPLNQQHQINRPSDRWNSTPGQYTGAPYPNLYLQSPTPPPGLGPGLVYYQAPPNQQPQMNKPGEHWNSTSKQYTGTSSNNLYLQSPTPPPGLGPGLVYYQAPPTQQPQMNRPGEHWNSTSRQYTGASSNNLYLQSPTPPPGLGPGLVYYQAPPTQQPQMNRPGEHWNSTSGQYTGAPSNNLYLQSPTPPPGLGPGLVYYQAPPNQQPQMNRPGDRWNSTSGQYNQLRVTRAAHQSRHQNLSWYNIHPNWYNIKPPAWNGTEPIWNQPGGKYYQNWYNNKPPVWNGTGSRWNMCGAHNFQWNITDSNNSTYFCPCRDNPQPWNHEHHHHHRQHKHRHHHKDDRPPPPPELEPPPQGAPPQFVSPPPPQFGRHNFNQPPPGWYPFSYCNNTLPESTNSTVTPSPNPWDTEVGSDTISSTQESELVEYITDVSVSSINGEGNRTRNGIEERDLNGSDETNSKNNPRPE